MISSQAKYNILTTEFHRITRRVTNHADVYSNLARIIVDLLAKGYMAPMLAVKLCRLFHDYGALRGFRGQGRVYVRWVVQMVVQLIVLQGLNHGLIAALRAAGFY